MQTGAKSVERAWSNYFSFEAGEEKLEEGDRFCIIGFKVSGPVLGNVHFQGLPPTPGLYHLWQYVTKTVRYFLSGNGEQHPSASCLSSPVAQLLKSLVHQLLLYARKGGERTCKKDASKRNLVWCTAPFYFFTWFVVVVCRVMFTLH
ncbi:putative alpha-tubulin I [Toxoplasma gondii RUB]|uniref:Putative alpha-tubulin I n=1 Tax=Toxoplasma gondii RUB TaxID=935652 RepID=A0A086M479_TOXGO|nr:putative alpha-tubulin I [Toxoplasma gondii RUB]